MAFDAGANDNNGLGPIIANYLDSGSEHGQILVLLINQLGDHQVELHFRGDKKFHGYGCETEFAGSSFSTVFDKVEANYKQSFEDFGGVHTLHEHEPVCALRFPNAVFFEDYPPQQHRFDNPKIPNSVTWAYKK